MLGLARSAEILARDRELCLVVPERDGGWRLRSRRGELFAPSPRLSPPGRAHERVADAFCHAFEPGGGDTVLDVGAGVGREALVFAQLVGPRGAVHCLEPHPETFALLARTQEANRLENVRCHQLAVAQESGNVRINTEQEPRLYYRNKLVSESGGALVPAATLASFIRDQEIERVDLLAMNIEGAETAALRGMAAVADRVRNVAIACHDFIADETGDDRMRTKSDVRALLESNGFTVGDRAVDGPAWRRDFVYGVRR